MRGGQLDGDGDGDAGNAVLLAVMGGEILDLDRQIVVGMQRILLPAPPHRCGRTIQNHPARPAGRLLAGGRGRRPWRSNPWCRRAGSARCGRCRVPPQRRDAGSPAPISLFRRPRAQAGISAPPCRSVRLRAAQVPGHCCRRPRGRAKRRRSGKSRRAIMERLIWVHIPCAGRRTEAWSAGG